MSEAQPLSEPLFEQVMRSGERALLAHIADGARGHEIVARLVDVLESLMPQATCVALSADHTNPHVIAAGPRARALGARIGEELVSAIPRIRRRIVDDHGRVCATVVVQLAVPASASEELAFERLVSLASIVFRRERTERARLDTWPARNDPPSGGAIRTRVGALAHEIRNALFGVAATLDAFDERFSISHDHARYVGVIRDELARVSTLMQGFLAHGDPRALRSPPVSMREVLEAARAACRARADGTDVAITIEIESELPPLRFDRKELIQVFRDLVLDALVQAPPGSSVRLVARRSDEIDGTYAVCDVLDEGPRFADLDASSLQEPFFTKRRGGNGPASMSSHRIVARHGGTIEAGNRAVRGSVVRVRIPL